MFCMASLATVKRKPHLFVCLGDVATPVIKNKYQAYHSTDTLERICCLFINLISEASLWYNPVGKVQLSVLTKHCCLHQLHVISRYQEGLLWQCINSCASFERRLSLRKEFNMLICREIWQYDISDCKK